MLQQCKVFGLWNFNVNPEKTKEVLDIIKKTCPDKNFQILFSQDILKKTAVHLFDYNENKHGQMNPTWNVEEEELLEMTNSIIKKVPQFCPKLDWTNEMFRKQKLGLSSKHLYERLHKEMVELKKNDENTIYIIPDITYNDEASVIRKFGGVLLLVEEISPNKKEEILSSSQGEEKEDGKKRTTRKRKANTQKGKPTKSRTKRRGPGRRSQKELDLLFQEKLNEDDYDFKLILGNKENVERVLSNFFNSSGLKGSQLSFEDCSLIPHENFKKEHMQELAEKSTTTADPSMCKSSTNTKEEILPTTITSTA